MSIKWLDELPPACTRGRKPAHRPKYYAFAQALKTRPGTWAQLGTKMNSSIEHQIKVGKVPAFLPAGAFEAATRQTGADGRGTIFVRYIGAAASDED